MIAGIPLSIVVEAVVSVLLLLTLGYCVVLNQRLKRLHQDKDALRTMITDLVSATTLAQRAVGELRTTASDCEFELGRRIDQAAGMQDHLSKHVSAGQHVIDRLANITQAIGSPSALAPLIASPVAPVDLVPAPAISAAPAQADVPLAAQPVAAAGSLEVAATVRQSDMDARIATRLDAMQDGEKSTKEKLNDLFAKLESQRSRGAAA